ncbi:sensor histidine kinase [Hathewaya proteolytica]|nr:ATP-binding protein [Hathewaya proteolytica]
MKKSILKSMSVIVILSIVISCFLIGFAMYTQFYDGMKNEVRKEAAYVEEAMNAVSENNYVDYLKKLDRKLRNTRFTLIEKDGTVVYDSREDFKNMENHGKRPEVIDALKNGSGEAVRFSETLKEQNFYYALMLQNGKIMRVATTTHSVFVTMKNMIPAVVIILIIVMLLAVIMANYETEKLVKPINELDLEHPLENEVYDELSPLLKRIYRQNQLIATQINEIRHKQGELSVITENMKEGLLVLDNRERIISINNTVMNLFNIEKKEYANVHILSLIRNNTIYNAIQDCLNGNVAEAVIQIEDKDFSIIGSPVITDGELRGVIILVIDVTEKYKNEKMRKEFSANVSHELKTPLMSISGYAELIKSNMVKAQDIPDFAGRIYNEAQRLSNLVEDIIRLSQLDEEEMVMQFEDIDLFEIAEEVCKQLANYAKNANVELKVMGEKVIMPGVRQIMKEVIYNLCDNSIKYNVPKGSVTINVYNKEGSDYIEVTDTGIGIPESERERIFERFYRVDKSHSKETGGTGLGLSIVKHGVLMHHGKITVSDVETGGTHIVLCFNNRDIEYN